MKKKVKLIGLPVHTGLWFSAMTRSPGLITIRLSCPLFLFKELQEMKVNVIGIRNTRLIVNT